MALQDGYTGYDLALAFVMGCWLTFGVFLVMEQIAKWVSEGD